MSEEKKYLINTPTTIKYERKNQAKRMQKINKQSIETKTHNGYREMSAVILAVPVVLNKQSAYR